MGNALVFGAKVHFPIFDRAKPGDGILFAGNTWTLHVLRLDRHAPLKPYSVRRFYQFDGSKCCNYERKTTRTWPDYTHRADRAERDALEAQTHSVVSAEQA